MEKILKDYYKVIFETSADGILQTNPDGKILKVNPALCKMLQRTEEEICEIGITGILDANGPRFQAALEERGKNGKVQIELDFLRKDGSKFLADFTSVLTQDKEGKFWATTSIKDMTVSK